MGCIHMRAAVPLPTTPAGLKLTRGSQLQAQADPGVLSAAHLLAPPPSGWIQPACPQPPSLQPIYLHRPPPACLPAASLSVAQLPVLALICGASACTVAAGMCCIDAQAAWGEQPQGNSDSVGRDSREGASRA